LSWEEGTREDSLPQGIGRHGERSGCERRFKGFNEVYSYRADYGRDPHTWCRWREVRLKTSGMKRDTTCRHKMEPVDPSRSFIFSRGRWVVTGGKLRARRRSRAMRHGGSLPAGHRTAQGLWCSVRQLGLPLTLGVKGFLWHQRPFRMHPGATCDTSRGDEGLEARVIRGRDRHRP
jgi:hypothetical protein